MARRRPAAGPVTVLSAGWDAPREQAQPTRTDATDEKCGPGAVSQEPGRSPASGRRGFPLPCPLPRGTAPAAAPCAWADGPAPSLLPASVLRPVRCCPFSQFIRSTAANALLAAVSFASEFPAWPRSSEPLAFGQTRGPCRLADARPRLCAQRVQAPRVHASAPDRSSEDRPVEVVLPQGEPQGSLCRRSWIAPAPSPRADTGVDTPPAERRAG